MAKMTKDLYNNVQFLGSSGSSASKSISKPGSSVMVVPAVVVLVMVTCLEICGRAVALDACAVRP